MSPTIQLVECPRDAMQGWPKNIATGDKVAYINALLQVGFDTIDFGSFVSPKHIPQMADTKAVISQLQPGNSRSKLLAIVANERGAEEASEFDLVHSIGYPFSISETFQKRNANSSIDESLLRVHAIRNICTRKNKEPVIYISMAFGNPYGDEYSEEIVYHWVKKIAAMDINIISLADTVGVASSESVQKITQFVIDLLPGTTVGVHLHSTAANWQEKFKSALDAGCCRFDGALKGIGGCPMADDVLVGNMNSEWMIDYLQALDLNPPLDESALKQCIVLADQIFKP